MERQLSKPPLKGMMLALVLLIASALVLIYQANHESKRPNAVSSEPVKTDIRASATAEDLRQLWKWTDSELQGGAAAGSWHVRFDVDRITKEQLDSIALQLGVQWTIRQDQHNSAHQKSEPEIWEGKMQHSDGVLSLWATSNDEVKKSNNVAENGKDENGKEVSDKEDNTMMLVIRYDADHIIRDAALLAVISELNQILDNIDVESQLSFNVHGYSLRADSGQRLAASADAIKRESYKDRSTRSTTWYTPDIHGFVEVGNNKPANLQIAVHQESGKDREGTSFVIGIPLITGDYWD